MKRHYDQETDSLYIDLADRPSAESKEVRPGVVLDFDSDGNLVGIDIDNASKMVNVSELTDQELLDQVLDMIQNELDLPLIKERLREYDETGEGVPWEQIKAERGL